MRYATCDLCGNTFWSSLGEGTCIVVTNNGELNREYEICGECQDRFEAFEQERRGEDGNDNKL